MGHGDASGAESHHQGRGGVPGSCVWPLCDAHCVHPAGHGGLVGLPPRSSTSLVGLSNGGYTRVMCLMDFQVRDKSCNAAVGH